MSFTKLFFNNHSLIYISLDESKALIWFHLASVAKVAVAVMSVLIPVENTSNT